MIHHSVNKQPVTIIQSMHPHPAWGGGGVKNFRKVFACEGQKFLFWLRGLYIWGEGGGNFVGRGGSRNFEVKIKTT